MAKQLQNDKGFLIIKLSWREYVAATDTWGWADCCQQNTSEDDLYFISVLDQVYCPICYEAWYDTARRYKSDFEKEHENFIKMKNKLKDLGCWDV